MRALSEIEADIENVRTAWRYYLDQTNVQQLWKFIKPLWYLHFIRWWNQAGMGLFARAIKDLEGRNDDESTALRALAMEFQSYFMTWLGFAEQGYELAEEGVTILESLDHPESLVIAYYCLVLNAFFVRRYSEEFKASNKMVEVATKTGDQWLLSFSYFTAGMSALIARDYTKARQLAKSNLNLSEQLGDRIGSSNALIILGHAAFALAEYELAREYYLRCLALSQEPGFHYAIQTSSKYLCKVALSLNEIDEAKQYLLQSLTISKEIGFIRDIVNLIYEFARLKVAYGDFERAVELLAVVIAHPASDLYRTLEGRIRDSARDLLVQIEGQLPPDVYAAALLRARDLDLDVVTDELLTSNG
jgi:tetratricopeptide (TPR) repeat protein